MEDIEFESDIEINEYKQEENDYLPNLTSHQEQELDEIPETIDKVEALLKMLNIPLTDNIEPDLSHMKDFNTEDNIEKLYHDIKENTDLFTHLNPFSLLYFLHPNHNPPF